MIFLRILKESFIFALHALRVNMLRTILSLLGITIGIFTIISVFTVVDSLERSIRTSFQSLGSDVVYVQKMPWGGGDGDYEWWKYFQRPNPGYREFEKLEKRVASAQDIAFGFGMNKTIKHRLNSVENATLLPVSHGYYNLWEYEIERGRYFSSLESKSGTPVAVLGAEIAEGLFGTEDPLDKEFTVVGRKVRVIGVFKKQGKSLVGQNVDEFAVIPVNFIRSILNVDDQNGSFIMAKAAPGVEVEMLKDEVRGVMRSIRKLKPKAEDNFAINESSMLSSGLDVMFGILGMAGWAIGGFSILVGGFGIANIMFVSVRERTNQIGIQKSLGAKNYFVLLQFLLESVVLCLIGGAIGLFLVFILMFIITKASGFDMMLTMGNIIQGLTISASIGLISGFIPAYMASRLDPVEAIRAGG